MIGTRGPSAVERVNKRVFSLLSENAENSMCARPSFPRGGGAVRSRKKRNPLGGRKILRGVRRG